MRILTLLKRSNYIATKAKTEIHGKFNNSLSFVVTNCTTRCQLLYHSSFAVIRCTIHCHSLSFVVTLCHSDHVHTLPIDTVPEHFCFAMTCPHNMQNIAEQTVHIQLERHRTSETWRQLYRKQIQ